MRALAITGMETAPMMPSIMSGSLIREMPPSARMSAGTRSRAMTATAPASSAILACSGVTTSMITPPLSCSAMPRLTRSVPVPAGGVPLGDSCAATGCCLRVDGYRSAMVRPLSGGNSRHRRRCRPSPRDGRRCRSTAAAAGSRAGGAAGAAAGAAAPGCRGRRRCRTAARAPTRVAVPTRSVAERGRDAGQARRAAPASSRPSTFSASSRSPSTGVRASAAKAAR